VCGEKLEEYRFDLVNPSNAASSFAQRVILSETMDQFLLFIPSAARHLLPAD
jgi:hypothetical protein